MKKSQRAEGFREDSIADQDPVLKALRPSLFEPDLLTHIIQTVSQSELPTRSQASFQESKFKLSNSKAAIGRRLIRKFNTGKHIVAPPRILEVTARCMEGEPHALIIYEGEVRDNKVFYPINLN